VAAVGVIATMLLLGVPREPTLLSQTLRPVSYPADWYSAAKYLRQHHVTGPTVVLPWHHYLSLSLARDRVVQNPADVFFPGRILVSLEPEITSAPEDDDYADIALAEIRNSRTCALSRALRAHDARAAVVIPVLEGPEDVSTLQRCGFRLVHGDAASVAVLVAPRAQAVRPGFPVLPRVR
jgi:hypothetical protein